MQKLQFAVCVMLFDRHCHPWMVPSAAHIENFNTTHCDITVDVLIPVQHCLRLGPCAKSLKNVMLLNSHKNQNDGNDFQATPNIRRGSDLR